MTRATATDGIKEIVRGLSEANLQTKPLNRPKWLSVFAAAVANLGAAAFRPKHEVNARIVFLTLNVMGAAEPSNQYRLSLPSEDSLDLRAAFELAISSPLDGDGGKKSLVKTRSRFAIAWLRTNVHQFDRALCSSSQKDKLANIRPLTHCELFLVRAHLETNPLTDKNVLLEEVILFDVCSRFFRTKPRYRFQRIFPRRV